MRVTPALLLTGLALVMVTGCGEEEAPPPTFPVTFQARSDGSPLAGVNVLIGGASHGITGDDGRLQVSLEGEEGTMVAVQVQCPEGFREPAQVQPISLRQIIGLDPANPGLGIERQIECLPEQRNGVIVVRSVGQADLPILLDGLEVARTDRSGVAHIPLRRGVEESFQVQIATADRPLLRPQDPTRVFTLHDADEAFVFDQPFQVEAPPRRRRRRRRRRAPTAPRIPVRIR